MNNTKALVPFLDRLLTFESGIDIKSHDFYVDNFYEEVINYPQVSQPGYPKRDKISGKLQFKKMTVQEYFHSLGVLHLFNPEDKNSLINMRFSVINCLGFVGYQLGEAILITTGYYRPVSQQFDIGGKKSFLESYYTGGVDEKNWRGGSKQTLYTFPEERKQVLSTDSNYWLGEFTGKDGIFTFEDFTAAENQNRILQTVVTSNLDWLKRQFLASGIPLSYILAKSWRYKNREDKSCQAKCSMSGIAASAHLCGALATFNFLTQDKISYDEIGTSIVDYMDMFGDLDLFGVCDLEFE